MDLQSQYLTELVDAGKIEDETQLATASEELVGTINALLNDREGALEKLQEGGAVDSAASAPESEVHPDSRQLLRLSKTLVQHVQHRLPSGEENRGK